MHASRANLQLGNWNLWYRQDRRDSDWPDGIY
jgi:hypothetical protein